jgi:glycosyltransferase involved in cell wall biosynthesis
MGESLGVGQPIAWSLGRTPDLEPAMMPESTALEPGSEVLLSICVPTRNRPDLLLRNLQAVLGQIGPGDPVEVLVSDNSEDSATAELVSGLAREATPIGYSQNVPPVSMSENHNRLIARARGRYILFVHDDDYLLEDGLQGILGSLSRNPPDDVRVFGVRIVDIDGKTLKTERHRARRRMGRRKALMTVLSSSSYVRVPGLVVSAKGYAASGGFETEAEPAIDFAMNARLFGEFGATTETAIISAYTVHSAATTTGMFNEATLSRLNRLFQSVKGTGVLTPREVERCRSRHMHQFVLGGTYRCIRSGDNDTARRIMALFHTPEFETVSFSWKWLAARLGFALYLKLF